MAKIGVTVVVLLCALVIQAFGKEKENSDRGKKESTSKDQREARSDDSKKRDDDKKGDKDKKDKHEDKDCDDQPQPPKDQGKVPAAPSGLRAEAVSLFQINLTWTDNSTNELGFKIERSQDGTNYSQIAQVLPNTVVYRDLNRFPDTKYFYRARAFNAKGDSAYSIAARAQTPAPECELSVASSKSFFFWTSGLPEGLTNIVGIAQGNYHATVLRNDGSVVSWSPYFPGNIFPSPADNSNIVSVAAGKGFSLAVKSNGKVVFWGDYSVERFNIPSNLTSVVGVAAGDYHCLALKSDGTVVGWGDNSYGQATPPIGLSGVVAIAAGSYHSVALKSDGRVVVWGYGVNFRPITWPLPPPEQGTNYFTTISNIVAISADGFKNLALHADGKLSSWNQSGYTNSPPPDNLTHIVAIAAGSPWSYALDRDGTVVAWGVDAGTVIPPPPPAPLQGVVAISVRSYFNLFLTINPTAPTSLTPHILATNHVALTWVNASVAADSIIVERATSAPSGGLTEWVTIGYVAGGVTNYDDTTTARDQFYAYQVKSVNACGISFESSPATITTVLTGIPMTISGVMVANPLRITQLTPTNRDVLLTWTATGGTTNVVEATTQPTGNFTPVSPRMILSGSGNVTTNYLDVGALTNSSSRFYRIRLVP